MCIVVRCGLEGEYESCFCKQSCMPDECEYPKGQKDCPLSAPECCCE